MKKDIFVVFMPLILLVFASCEYNANKSLTVSREINSRLFNNLFISEIDSFVKTNKVKDCDICVDIYSKYRDIFFYIKSVSPKYNNRNKPLNYITRRGIKVYLSTSIDELACNYNDSARFDRNEYQRTIRCWYVEMRNEVKGIHESKELVPKNYKIQFVDTTGRKIYGLGDSLPKFR